MTILQADRSKGQPPVAELRTTTIGHSNVQCHVQWLVTISIASQAHSRCTQACCRSYNLNIVTHEAQAQQPPCLSNQTCHQPPLIAQRTYLAGHHPRCLVRTSTMINAPRRMCVGFGVKCLPKTAVIWPITSLNGGYSVLRTSSMSLVLAKLPMLSSPCIVVFSAINLHMNEA